MKEEGCHQTDKKKRMNASIGEWRQKESDEAHSESQTLRNMANRINRLFCVKNRHVIVHFLLWCSSHLHVSLFGCVCVYVWKRSLGIMPLGTKHSSLLTERTGCAAFSSQRLIRYRTSRRSKNNWNKLSMHTHLEAEVMVEWRLICICIEIKIAYRTAYAQRKHTHTHTHTHTHIFDSYVRKAGIMFQITNLELISCFLYSSSQHPICVCYSKRFQCIPSDWSQWATAWVSSIKPITSFLLRQPVILSSVNTRKKWVYASFTR